MRVTTLTSYFQTSQSIGASLSRVQAEQAKVASGKQITAWSDDAPAASAVERYRAQEADWNSFQRSGNDAKSWLGAADGTLQSMSSIMTRVKQLAVSANSGALTGTSRAGIADELDQLRGELRDLANTTHLGRALFAGFGAQAVATDPVTGALSWAGDDGQVQRQVSPTITLQVNVSGKDLLGFNAPAGQDVFSTLTALSNAVRTGNSASVSSLQDVLESRHGDMLRALGTVGTTTNRVDAALTAGGTALTDLASRRSDLEDVDLADAVVKLNAAQAGYTAALGAASRANLPSLADFLK
jgi:flagellar hook-associated protein 3 FlgL